MTEETNLLHIAICRAVSITNMAPELVRLAEGRQIRDILRQALIDYADAEASTPPALVSDPEAPPWLLNGDVAQRIGNEHRVPHGAVQAIAKEVHSLMCAAPPPREELPEAIAAQTATVPSEPPAFDESATPIWEQLAAIGREAPPNAKPQRIFYGEPIDNDEQSAARLDASIDAAREALKPK
jgi:hypothetical protein